MRLNYFKNISLIAASSLLFISCGGGGGSSGTETPISQIVASGTAADNTRFAWHINSSIDSTYKTKYSIDSSAHMFMPTVSSSNKIKVAVIDEDFEVTHPDIADKIVSTYNVMNGSTTVSGTTTDTYSHGTAVAGVIGSTYLGVTPNNVELILINIDLSNSISESYYLAAFNKAQELGAQVINCSWGGSAMSQALSNKIQTLRNAGINVVFASGNSSLNLDTSGNDDESESPYVLGIGASSVLNDVTSYSNYGSTIDLIAPGGGGYDSSNNWLLGLLGLDLTGTDGDNETLDIVTNNYSFTAGTSFAAPGISGVIALMLAHNSNLTPDQIRNILISTTDKVGGTSASYVDDGSGLTFDTKRAYGKVNAAAAVQAAINTP